MLCWGIGGYSPFSWNGAACSIKYLIGYVLRCVVVALYERRRRQWSPSSSNIIVLKDLEEILRISLDLDNHYSPPVSTRFVF